MKKESDMMNKTGFAVFDQTAYFYPYAAQCIQPVKNSWFYRGVKKTAKIFDAALPKIFINPAIFEFGRLVICDSAMSVGFGNFLHKYFNQQQTALYYMNVIDADNEKYMQYFKNIYTFDYADAVKYQIGYRHTPYKKIAGIEIETIETENRSDSYDVLYLGKEKGRKDSIQCIYDALIQNGLKVKFMVPGSGNSDLAIQTSVKYQDYISMIRKTKCLAEVNVSGQSGCSLRFLEALFYKKKLITNNRYLVNDPYYNHKNVFIIGMDDMGRLREFVDTPYVIPDQSLEALEFDFWLEHF